ncbi:allantoinase, mitochondrial precursor [Lineolata rhizophorae]|uniref:Allantoinase, mitochondrial n=1 Tax=Lineolata rhizophorae TaxID=578093 RepID=A0A6A6NV62_9PEZI|nr:allantoinase, mitochondrial precursor [Lineolata rhizophorae]
MAPHATSASSTSSSSRSSPTPPDTTTNPPITVLASSRAVVSGRLTAATLVISLTTGKITSLFHSVLPASSFPPGTPYADHTPRLLLPGLVDAHVHLNEPGRTEWEGFWTGTRAAAVGGVTTVVDMPLNAIPPTTTVAALREKVDAARGKCWVDVGFYGGLVPGNTGELKALVREGVRGFKGFLIDSGPIVAAEGRKTLTREEQVEEFPAVHAGDIAAAMAELADAPTVLMFHAEMIPPISASVGDVVQRSLPPLEPTGPLSAYRTFLDSRPPSFETYAIGEILSLAPRAPALPLHIVHLSAAEAAPLLRAARARGVRITAETCFHYLSLAAEDVRDGDTRHKCCPPIRGRANRDRLWAELLSDDGVIQTVVSDHSPCTPGLKLLPPGIDADPGAAPLAGCCGRGATPDEAAPAPAPAALEREQHGERDDEAGQRGDFFAAWGGISSVGLGLPILWTEAVGRRGADPGGFVEDAVRWCARNTAAQVGLGHAKGDLAVGLDGDVAVFDDEVEWTLGRERLLFRNKCSPYEGRRLRGRVVETWVRGRRVWGLEEGFAEKEGPGGRLILEERRK